MCINENNLNMHFKKKYTSYIRTRTNVRRTRDDTHKHTHTQFYHIKSPSSSSLSFPSMLDTTASLTFLIFSPSLTPAD